MIALHLPCRHPYLRLLSHIKYIMEQYTKMYRRSYLGPGTVEERLINLTSTDWQRLVRE